MTPGARTRGHTLMELILVLTILSLFAVIVIPRMVTALIRRRLDTAVDALRADLTFTRARAISTGLRHQLVLVPSTGELAVQPYRPEAEAAGGNGAANQTAVSTIVHQDQLPAEVRVVVWNVYPLASGQVTPTASGAVQDGAPLTFYPQGTSDSAQVVLQDEEGTLRGLVVDGFNGDIREMDADELGKQ